MPIEDADKVHSRQNEGTIIKIFGYKLTFMKLMTIVGVGIAGLFLLTGAIMMMTPPPTPVIENVTATPSPITTNMSFDIIQNNYNCRIIQINYSGSKSFNNFKTDVLLSMYPPLSSPYIQRQSIINEEVSLLNNRLTKLYIYTGPDNAFHVSYTIPKYEDCVDFINGDWSFNVDDGKLKTNLYKYKFVISNSTTRIINNGSSINASFSGLPDYSTAFVYSGTYKERINLVKTTRLIGVGNPVIDAGGYGAAITVKSSNNLISGFTLMNSGNKNYTDGGIVTIPGSSGNTISKNDIYRSIHGIFIYQSNSNIITNNTIHNNDYTGIILIKSKLNTISNNIVHSNINGIHLDSESDSNVIKDNKLYNNKKYGVLIDNYKNLHNICEYNIYKSDIMSCSDSVNRDQISPIQTGIIPSITNEEDTTDWENCEGNPKCYQSK